MYIVIKQLFDGEYITILKNTPKYYLITNDIDKIGLNLLEKKTRLLDLYQMVLINKLFHNMHVKTDEFCFIIIHMTYTCDLLFINKVFMLVQQFATRHIMDLPALWNAMQIV